MEKVYDNKLKNLVLYVLAHPDYREGGIKKLNKLLYFIDFYFYRDHERQITDAKYAKAHMGPVIDQYQELFQQLESDGAISGETIDGRMIYKPLEKYNLKEFNAAEIDHIARVLSLYGKLEPADLEAISHRQQPWLLTEKYGDLIDPDLALLMGDTESGAETIEVKNDQLKHELVELANAAD